MHVDEAAKLLKMNTQTLRLWLQQKLFPFWGAIKTSKNRYAYHINEKELENYLKGYAYETDSNHWDVSFTNPNRVC